MRRERAVERLRGRRRLWLCVFDLTSWGAALALAALGRMDFHVDLVNWQYLAEAWVLVGMVHLVVGWVVRLHHGRAELALLEEMLLLGAVTLIAGSLLAGINLATSPQLVPRSVSPIATFMTVAL